MLKLENSIRGLSFSRVAFDLTIQDIKILIFLERTFKSIAMDTDFLIDIIYHSVIGYVR